MSKKPSHGKPLFPSVANRKRMQIKFDQQKQLSIYVCKFCGDNLTYQEAFFNNEAHPYCLTKNKNNVS